jgi:hypothetical protein
MTATPSSILRHWLMAVTKPEWLRVVKKTVPITATPIALASCWTAFKTPEPRHESRPQKRRLPDLGEQIEVFSREAVTAGLHSLSG